MDLSEIPILIVSDSESTNHLIAHVLSKGNFTNIHFCKGTVDALQFLEKNPARILLTEWQLEDLDGLELANHVKDMDEGTGHYSYTIVFSNREPNANLTTACQTSVDGFLRKQDLRSHLLGMMYAAARISTRSDHLDAENVNLKMEVETLQSGQLLDSLTGLGNRKMAEQSLTDIIKQIEARGGAVCYLLIGIENYRSVRDQQGQRIADQLICAIADRLQHLIRPMDVAVYLESGRFALILLQPGIDQCTRECYQRIHDGIALKSYVTTAGYIPARVGTAICASEALTGPPNLTTIMKHAEADLQTAYKTGQIQVRLLSVEAT